MTERTTPTTDPADRKRIDISIVLDRSGSMRGRKDEAIRAFNDFLAEQRGVEGKARVSLVQFDHEYETVFSGRKLAEAPALDEATYRPRGRTALLDAIGRTATATEARLAARARKRRDAGKPVDAPDVLQVVITDGFENASSEFGPEAIKALIDRLEGDHDWTFLFLGTTEAAVCAARGLGIDRDRAFAMGETPEAYAEAQRLVGSKVHLMREMEREASIGAKRAMLAFTEEEREAARKRDRS